jgi:hypothetical protein
MTAPYVPPAVVDAKGKRDALKYALLLGGARALASGSWPGSTPGMALGAGLEAGLNGYQGAMNSALSLQQSQQEQQRLSDIMQQRRGVFEQFPIPPNASRDQAITQYRNALSMFIQNGDTDMVGKLTEYLKSADQPQSQASQAQPRLEQIMGPDGQPTFAHIMPDGSTRILDARPVVNRGSQAAPRTGSGVNPATGKPEIFQLSPGGAINWTGISPTSNANAVPTADERKSGVLLTLVKESGALGVLDKALPPNVLENMIKRQSVWNVATEKQQLLDNAGMIVADAYIRLTSGANAPEPEVRRTMQMIVPQPGDSPALLAQKMKNRQALAMALKAAAGRAAAPGSTATMQLDAITGEQ